ncbi:MAG: aminopeptidase [Gammaproteobacteria bacterium]|nr:aminopeptidase [Gammaproteobacteria bacterium]
MRSVWHWVGITAFCAGCSPANYYAQSVEGHLGVLSHQESIDELLHDLHTPPALKQKLTRVVAVRDFASKTLGLPDNDSYRTYSDIKRNYVVWNVFATPRYSLAPIKWCFMVVGCVNYRGYYSESEAREFARALEKEGNDVYVDGVPAYSTLGWLADPVLNTMIDWSDTQIASLIFHELAHQVVFIKDDTEFNESFATAVARIGLLYWLRNRPDADAATERYLAGLETRQEFLGMLNHTRAALQDLYALPLTQEEIESAKQLAFRHLREGFDEMQKQGVLPAHYADWFKQPLSNARFVVTSAYEDHIPAFTELFARSGYRWSEFYRQAAKLSRLDAPLRHEKMRQLQYAAKLFPSFARSLEVMKTAGVR